MVLFVHFLFNKWSALIVNIFLLSCFLWLIAPVKAALIAEKTPSDVYVQVQLLSQDVHALRDKNKISTAWPEIVPEQGREPRHVFQKTLEILDKINRYRMNVSHIGGITVPRFPGRDITPNEVYSVVIRLRQELALLVGEDHQFVSHMKASASDKMNITSNEVYAALSEISIALDETLGIRGITPSEVYIRSEQVLALARFLRNSQNQSIINHKPKRRSNQLPNHALHAVNRLLLRINKAEHNLWMKPIKVSPVPRQVITPGDVYDAMGLVLAELQRIQFRLGLERSFATTTLKSTKTPDDVIQNVEFATQQLPLFKVGEPLHQYDRTALVKTPNHVYSVTEHILRELKQYRHLRGIQARPRKAVLVHGLQPQHVYGKTLEVIEKINLIRQSQNIGAISEPLYPLRKITPTEVFNETLRVDEELHILFRFSNMKSQLWITDPNVNEYTDKTPSDVFFNMQRISLLLDTILGVDAFTPDYVYREAKMIQQEIFILAQHLGRPLPLEIWQTIKLDLSVQPETVFKQVKLLLDTVLSVERRAGMFQVKNFSVPHSDVVTPAEVFNLVRVVSSEMTELKVFLGIDQLVAYQPKVHGKQPGHVLQLIQGNQAALELLLHKRQNPKSEILTKIKTKNKASVKKEQHNDN